MSLRRVVVVLVLAVLVAAGGVLVWAWRTLDAPLPTAAERVEVRISSGASARAIARELRVAGVDVEPALFVIAARFAGVAESLRAGRYEIVSGTTLRQLLEKLRSGDTLREKFTIVEGWTFRDLRSGLAGNAELKQDSAKLTEQQILKAIGAAETRAEGLFAADTYLFDAGTSDLDLLRQAYRAQSGLLRDLWTARNDGLPYASPYEALILASIVEKETGQAGERDRIAGVFVNRLRRRMLLQTDPTVIYGLGEKFDGNLRKRDLETDGPYNTYTRPGLPPTPIALPGRAALQATLRPAATRDLYFVARGDGSSQFSETLEQHNRAVAKYQLGGGRKAETGGSR